MIDFWEKALIELKKKRKVFAAFVASNSKGSPGTTQARLLVFENGKQFGTIGGGVMEKQLLADAKAALDANSYSPRIQQAEHKSMSQNPSGLICGGWQKNVLLTLAPEADIPTVEKIYQAAVSRLSATVRINESGLQLLEKPTDRDPRLHLKEGSDWEFSFSLTPARTIAIFGAGHCGCAVARQMLRLGYQVSLFDERKDLADLPDASAMLDVYCGIAPSSFVSKIDDWPHRYAVIMTHSYPTDFRALFAVLPRNPAFLGLMGSVPKLRKIFQQLRDDGCPDEHIKRIIAPVGLPINSDTPEEIAVSVAAQIIQHRNNSLLHEQYEPDYATA